MSNFRRRLGMMALCALAGCGGGGGGGGGGPVVVAPSNLVYPRTLEIFLVDLPIPADTPTYSGSASTFSVLPGLPAGFTLNPQTGAISGTPTQSSPRTTYTVRASNSAGSTTASLDFGVALPPRFAYIVNQTDSTITVCTVDADTGRTHHAGYQLAPPSQTGPERMTVHPSGRFAYVPNQNTSNLSVYTLDLSQGWLTAGTPVSLGSGPHDVAIDPAGEFAYVTSQNSNQLQVFAINGATGALSVVQLIPTDVQPSACAVDPTGQFLFVTLHGNVGTGQGSGIQSYQIDAATGAVTAALPVVSLNAFQPTDVSVDPRQNLMFVSLEKFDDVLPVHFDPITGAVSWQTASNTGDRPVAVTVDATGRFAYTANRNAGTVSCFAVDQTTGDLTPVSTTTAGAGTAAVQADPSGHFIFVLNTDAQSLAQYRIDETTGGLSLEESLVTRAGASHVAFAQGAHPLSRVPRFVHIAASGSDEIPTFSIAPASGVLTEELPNPPTDTRPISVASDPKHRFLYVANQTSTSIGTFTINPGTGVLAAVGSPASVAGTPTHATVDPSGRFLYLTTRDVVNTNDGWVTTWVINQGDGSIGAADTHQVVDQALWTGCDPTGSYLFVASKGVGPGAARISRLRISPTTGALTDLGSPTVASGVSALGFHPYKPALYAVLNTANSILTYTIDPATGNLVLVPGAGANGGSKPTSIALAPDGRFAYASYFDLPGFGHVSAFSVDPVTGKLVNPAVQYQDGLNPNDLALDGSGHYLYVANSASNDVSLFTVDSATGVLTVGSPKSSGMEPNALVVTTVTQ